MITRKPLHINDEEVSDGMSRDGQPLSHPTTMSYTVQSIRLAEICRNAVDRSPLATAHTGGLSHDAVMDIDTEFQTLINDVPAFYPLSESVVMRNYHLTQSEAKDIVFEGKILHFLLNLHRCKLHLPYLTRSFEDPAYSASREICIKHARLIMQSELWLDKLDIEMATRFKLSALLIGVFMACVVLIMDLCVNPTSPHSDKQRDEVRKSFQIIEAVHDMSETAGNSVHSLLHLLRQHNVAPLRAVPAQEPQTTTVDSSNISEQQSQATPFTAMTFNTSERLSNLEEIVLPAAPQGQREVNDSFDLAMATEEPLNEAGEDLTSYWTDFTQSFEQGIDFNNFDWDKIFSELDPAFV
ncbi:hypothetical protein H2200_010301 [Cladophialophora chaetospira]|uniref:Transcription factor domain-containing protein n=1 Tax=Cladophialophora chaetospira TaxID=386627 RepID=A0AA39CE67_9EURO|nr:hypothetical protein H2200_010301 [Cladophialophora chaetospira]